MKREFTQWLRYARGLDGRVFMRLALLLVVCMTAVSGWAEDETFSGSDGLKNKTTIESISESSDYTYLSTVEGTSATIKISSDDGQPSFSSNRLVFGSSLKNLKFDVEANAGYTIESVTFTYRSGNYDITTTGVTKTENLTLSTTNAVMAVNGTSATATVSNSSALKNANNAVTIESITVTYTKTAVEKKTAVIAFSNITDGTVSIEEGQTFTPEWTTTVNEETDATAHDLVKFSIAEDDQQYATVDETTGVVSAVKATTSSVTVTASISGSEAYNDASAKFNVTVTAAAQEPTGDAVTATFDYDNVIKNSSNIATYTQTTDGIKLTATSTAKNFKTKSNNDVFLSLSEKNADLTYKFELADGKGKITKVEFVYSDSKDYKFKGSYIVDGVTTEVTTATSSLTFTPNAESFTVEQISTLKTRIVAINVTYVEAEKTTTTMSIEPATVECYVGESVSMPTIKVMAGGTEIADPSLSYESSDETIVPVEEGIVSAPLKSGDVTITVTYAGDATYKGITGTFKIAAKDKAAISFGKSTISFKSNKETVTDNTYRVKVGSAEYAGALTNGSVTSSNTDVVTATLDETGKKVTLTYPTPVVEGSSTITLTYTAGEYGEISSSFIVTVLPASSAEVVLTEESYPAGKQIWDEDKNIVMTFGGVVNAKGSNIKGKGLEYTPSTVATGGYYDTDLDALIESLTAKGSGKDGFYFNHGLAKEETSAYDRMMNLPVYGGYFIFEPKKNGKLTVNVNQQGAVHTDGKNGRQYQKVRIRPLYCVDERGICLQATSATTTSHVSEDWAKVGVSKKLVSDDMYTAPKDIKAFYDACVEKLGVKIDGKSSENGVVPIFVLHADGKAYQMTANGKEEISGIDADVYNKMLAQYNNGGEFNSSWEANNDEAGYFPLDEAAITYTFDVKAGKTYFIFGDRTKLALKSFSLTDTTDPSATTALTLNGTNTNPDLTKDELVNVTVNRTFNANHWASLVLPFSVSPSQLKDIFGDEVKIVLFDKFDTEKSNLNLTKHFHQMVVAGLPMFIKPSKTVESPTFNNALIEETTVSDITDDESGYTMTGSYGEGTMTNGSFYMGSKDGKDCVKMYKGSDFTTKGTFAWIKTDAAVSGVSFTINGITDDEETSGIIEAVTEAQVAAEQAQPAAVYNINGQMVGRNVKLNSLPKGIYIYGGKKYVVK